MGSDGRMNSGIADHAILQDLFITLGMTLKIFLVHFHSTLKQFRVLGFRGLGFLGF
jgi:hypothetical protein